jgi:inosine-uridine nucleoside N-ribohydrolase
MALLREPKLVQKIPRIVMMGGAMGIGNVTPSAEFNIYADPEAAQIVFRSGIPITMVSLDVTHEVIFTREHITRLRAQQTPITSTFADLLTFHLDALAALGNTEGAAMHDPCAVAAVCDPSLLTTRFMHVDVEATGTLTRGRTVCDLRGRTGQPPNVHVGIDINATRFFEMLFERLC